MKDITREEIKNKVVECIENILSVTTEEASKESNNFIEDLAADSLDFVELVMEYEETFGFSISEEDAEKLTTVKSVIDYIESHKDEIVLSK